MYKLRPFLNSTMMKNIYYSIIFSHIVYAIQVWGSAGKIETDKILILQKRTIKLNFKLNCVSHPYNTRSNFIDINNILYI